MRRGLMTLAVLAASATAAAAADHRVGMAGHSFGEGMLKVKVGDRIIFENDDVMDHNVFVATRGHSFDLGNQKPGESRTYVVRQPGTFEIECTVHPDMIRRVEVSS